MRPVVRVSIYIQKVFPKAIVMRCVKHIDRNLRKALQRLQGIRSFATDERESLGRNYGQLGIDWVRNNSFCAFHYGRK